MTLLNHPCGNSSTSVAVPANLRCRMSKQAAAFRSLHNGKKLLVLPNAWDAGSARLVESLGPKAVATTSAGMAWAAGYPDGNKMPVDVVMSITQSIARVIKVPLTVDIEGGYSS